MRMSSPARLKASTAIILGFVALVTSGCGTSGPASPSAAASVGGATGGPTASSSPSSAATIAPTATVRRCPNPDGGTFNACLGPLEPGTYTTVHFRPWLTYTVPAGWGNLEDLVGNFLLLPPGATLGGVNPGTSDYLGVYTSVVAAGHCTGKPSLTVDRTFDGLVGWLKTDLKLAVTNAHDVTVSGLTGVVMDIVMGDPAGDGCPDGIYADVYAGSYPSDLIHGVIPDYRMRVYLLRNGAATLAIEVADATSGGSDIADWFAGADEIIKMFVFAPG